MRFPFATYLIFAWISAASAADQAHRTTVAQMAFLAQLAPKVCTDFKTNDLAVAAYMAGAQLNERELLDSLGDVTRPIAEPSRRPPLEIPMPPANRCGTSLGTTASALSDRPTVGSEDGLPATAPLAR